MDRKLFKRPFTKEWQPEWICPSCDKGVLTIKKDTLHVEELSHSRDHSHEAWDPDWVEYVYSCLLYCSNPSCKEVVASSGTGKVDFDVGYDEEGYQTQIWSDYFRPKFFQPPLHAISIPDSCPEQIKSALTDSFSLLFSSPSSAANCIRVSIELLLNDLKVKRYNLVKNKRRIISLHERISNIPPKHSDLKELILAVKWLGNAGSHDNEEVKIDDVLDAYEMTEHVLEEIYAPKRKKLTAIAKLVNKKKGPSNKR
jgi:hypothetical protein